jgi:type IV secretory pathway TraG/TraD family ATPase VirD4
LAFFYVKYIQHKTKLKPSADILDRFSDRYKNLKNYMVKKGIVRTIKAEKPAEKYATLASQINSSKAPSSFRLWLGISTGKLVDLWQKTGMAKNQHVSLDLEDSCQNIIVLGGIGSGKTTCVMQPLLLQCLDQECGGLIFDIKGDVKHAVAEISSATSRKLVFLGPGYNKINLLDGLTPEVAASFLKSAFLLNEKGHSDSFWIDTATELCRNTLGVLSFLPQHYNLQNLYQYLFDLDSKITIDNEISVLLSDLNEDQSRLLKTYQRYHETIFDQFDAKIKSGVNATVAQALSPFNHPALLDAFCSTEKSMIKMSDLIDGTVCIVDMPLSIWGLGGKVAYTFIKLRFFNLMQNRNQTDKDKNRPVFFMCDEFQEIVSASREGLSDLSFWDKSRSSKTIGIISSQSIASFYAALGNHDIANALLQNFRQKLFLRTEDPITLDFMEKLIGKAKIKKLSITRGYNADDASNAHNNPSGGGSYHSSNTVVDTREGVVDAQLVRELQLAHAISILSIAGQSMDDVLALLPVYID